MDIILIKSQVEVGKPHRGGVMVNRTKHCLKSLRDEIIYKDYEKMIIPFLQDFGLTLFKFTIITRLRTTDIGGFKMIPVCRIM